jgi:hypothetical protein
MFRYSMTVMFSYSIIAARTVSPNVATCSNCSDRISGEASLITSQPPVEHQYAYINDSTLATRSPAAVYCTRAILQALRHRASGWTLAALYCSRISQTCADTCGNVDTAQAALDNKLKRSFRVCVRMCEASSIGSDPKDCAMQHALVAAQIGSAVVHSIHLPMQGKTLRRFAFVILVLATVAVVHFWKDKSDSRTAVSSAPANKSQKTITLKPQGDADFRPSAAPLSRDTAAGGMPMEMTVPTPTRAMPPGAAAVQIEVRAPATVRVGDFFEATVNLEAHSGVRQVAFFVTYDSSVLQFVDSSEGLLVQQGGASAQFLADEPIGGRINVDMDVGDGSPIAGAGNLVILHFQAVRAGTSPLSLNSATSTTTSAHDALVTVE